MFFKNFVTSAAISLLVGSSAFAEGQQPPPSTQLDTVDYICAGEPLEYHCNTGGWHLNYIGMPEVWNTLDLFGDWQNGAGSVTDFSIGVYDQSFSQSTSNYPHEFIDFSLLESVDGNSGYGVGKFTAHGNMVVASVSAGKLGENFPTRPMIRAKTLTFSNKRRDGSSATFVEDLQAMIDHPDEPKVIGASIGFGLSLSVVKNYNEENDTNFEYDRFSHWESIRDLRELIKSNPDTLFILSAGNNAKRSMFANGLLHREYDSIDNKYRLKKLDNLIVVGSVAKTGTLARHSNYGKSVDITAPSLYLGLSCANKFGSGIRKAEITRNTEVLDFSYTERYGNDAEFGIGRHVSALSSEVFGFLSSPVDYANSLQCNNLYSANGTSAAQPLVLGAATILFHAAEENGVELLPYEVKNLLLYGAKKEPTQGSGGLLKATRRYVNPNKEPNGDDGVFEDSRGDNVKDLPSGQTIPILNVATSLNAFLATIPPEPTTSKVFYADGFKIVVSGETDGVRIVEASEPENPTGSRTLLIPKDSEVCIFNDSIPQNPNGFDSDYYTTDIGVQTNTPALVENNGSDLVYDGLHVIDCSIADTQLPSNEWYTVGGYGDNIYEDASGRATSMRSNEDMYIYRMVNFVKPEGSEFLTPLDTLRTEY